MLTVTREYQVYHYTELSEKAKEKAREWYIDDDLRPQLLQEDYELMLSEDFPNSELKVEFSLGYCQGDGLNIYGKVWLSEMLNKIDWSSFTAKEKRFIEWAVKWDDMLITLPHNYRYGYCVARQADFTGELAYDLENNSMRGVKEKALEKFDAACIDFFETRCGEWEIAGYKYLYEPDESEVEEMCEANEWLFFEDGKFFSL